MKRSIIVLSILLFALYANAGVMKSLGKAVGGAAALGASAAGAGIEYAADKEEYCGRALNTFNMNYKTITDNVNNNAYDSESSLNNDTNKLTEQGTELIRECNFVKMEDGGTLRDYINGLLGTNIIVEESKDTAILKSVTDGVDNIKKAHSESEGSSSSETSDQNNQITQSEQEEQLIKSESSVTQSSVVAKSEVSAQANSSNDELERVKNELAELKRQNQELTTSKQYSQSSNQNSLHVCYDRKIITGYNTLIYEGCIRSVSPCQNIGKYHFGKYPKNSKARAALERCSRGNPKFVDRQGL